MLFRGLTFAGTFRRLAAGALAFALGAAALPAAEAPPLRHERLGVANGCFVESVALLDDFTEANGSDHWSRLLRWGAEKDDEEVTGHAVAVCESGGAIWCWDVNFGWKRLATSPEAKDTVEAVSPAITARYPDISPRYPMFLQEFAQEPDPAPPSEVIQTENPEVHDVSVAAAALARHRPVNAVQFAYGTDGAEAVGAALIFEYNGRIFIYTPGKGTFASRARGSVHNVRLVAEMLRRLYPGARAVRPIAAG